MISLDTDTKISKGLFQNKGLALSRSERYEKAIT